MGSDSMTQPTDKDLEKARGILECDETHCPSHHMEIKRIATALAEARAAEREACAKTAWSAVRAAAENMEFREMDACALMADIAESAIRARWSEK